MKIDCNGNGRLHTGEFGKFMRAGLGTYAELVSSPTSSSPRKPPSPTNARETRRTPRPSSSRGSRRPLSSAHAWRDTYKMQRSISQAPRSFVRLFGELPEGPPGYIAHGFVTNRGSGW